MFFNTLIYVYEPLGMGSGVIELSKGYGYTRYFGEIPHSKPPCYERVGWYV